MLSLRIVISLWMAIALILIAAITLSITLTSSLSALRDIGSSHAAALLQNANLETATLFNVAATQTDLLRNMSMSRNWSWPSDDPTAFTAWNNLARGVYIGARGRVSSQIMAFGDGSTYLFSETATNGYAIVQYLPPPYSLPRPPGTLMGLTMESYSLTNGTLLTNTSIRVPVIASMSYQSQVTAIPAGTDRYSYQPSFQGRLLFGEITVRYQSFGVLPRHPSARSLPTFGFVTMSLGLETVSRYLNDARRTDGTAAFALNGEELVIGMALEQPTNVPFKRYPKNNQTANMSGCVTMTNNDNVTAPPEMVCLTYRINYPYAPLQQLPADMVGITQGNMVRQLTLDDARWFVAVSRVPLRMPGLRLVLILMTPEKDIIGDVVKSQNIAIGVSAAVVVVMAAASFAFIVAMLRPLDDVAERMLRAATFEPETEPLSMSAMQEVRDLQTAYKQMSAELNRIRSFVPQSVLQAGTANDMSDGDDDAVEAPDVDLDASAMTVHDLNRSRDSDSKSVVSESRKSKRTAKSGGGSEKTGKESKRSGATVAAALDCSVRTQPVSVLVANCNGFYEKAMGMSRDEVVASMASMVDRVMGEVKTKGGVLAFFHGDHFAATFNAVKPSPAHARNAAAVALALTAPTAGPRTSQGQLTLRAGVSTGKCLVGNVGSAEAKNFSVMGPAFTQALVLERLTRLYTTGEGAAVAALASRRTCEDIATNYLYEYVDLVQLPGSAQATLVGRLVGPKANGAANQHDTEWLYVVGADKSNDPHAASNAAMTELAMGKLGDVAKFLDVLRATAEDQKKPQVASTTTRVLESSVTAGVAVPTGLGRFYADCFASLDVLTK
jgi:class 3 adenylate cyclase